MKQLKLDKLQTQKLFKCIMIGSIIRIGTGFVLSEEKSSTFLYNEEWPTF